MYDKLVCDCELKAPFVTRFVCPFERIVKKSEENEEEKKVLYLACILYDDLSNRFRSRNEHLIVVDTSTNTIVFRRNYKFFSDSILHFEKMNKLVMIENSMVSTFDTDTFEFRNDLFPDLPCTSNLLTKKNEENGTIIVHQSGCIKVFSISDPRILVDTVLMRNGVRRIQDRRRRTRLFFDPNCFAKPEHKNFLIISNGTKIGVIDLTSRCMRAQVDTCRKFVRSLIFIPDQSYSHQPNVLAGRVYAGSKDGHLEIFDVFVGSENGRTRNDDDNEEEKEMDYMKSLRMIRIDQEHGGDITRLISYREKYLFINSKDSHRFNIYDITREEEVFGPGFIKEYCFSENMEFKNSFIFWDRKRKCLYSVNTDGKIYGWMNKLYDVQATERGKSEELERVEDLYGGKEGDLFGSKCVSLAKIDRNRDKFVFVYPFLMSEFEGIF